MSRIYASLAGALIAITGLMAQTAVAQTVYSSTPIRYRVATRSYPTVQRTYATPTYAQPTYQVSRPVYSAPVPTTRMTHTYTTQPTQVYRPAYTTAAPTRTPTSSYSSGGGGNVFSMLNAQRTRQGAPALMYDPTLQAVAQRRAQQMASMGLKNHPPGSFAPGKYEGVGWSSSYSPSGVSACFINDRRMRYAGAAMAHGRDGVYFAVVYR